ncbi:MAG TPA: hypothetical protein VF708_17130 [Pyrinomonadaceae bacterium]|jgi:hypothetical protein
MRKALVALVLAAAGLFAFASFVSSRERGEANTVLEAHDMAPVQADVIYDGFKVEVWVEGRPLEEYVARGRRYVEALEGVEYELRIRNPLGERVAVALSVDGLNTIDARRTSAWNASKWVINPYQTISIRGWQMSSSRARRFYFTTERDSYGAKIGQTANLGVISAVFFRERHPVTVVPPPVPMQDGREESKDRSSAGSSTSSAREPGSSSNKSGEAASRRRPDAYPVPDEESAATGIGRNERHNVRWIDMQLESRPAAEVSIRYEYRAALVRLGIIPRPYPYPYPDPLPRRERSTGFDDHRYSPEP